MIRTTTRPQRRVLSFDDPAERFSDYLSGGLAGIEYIGRREAKRDTKQGRCNADDAQGDDGDQGRL